MKPWIAALLLSAALPAMAAADDFPADRIIAMASGDWNKDGTPDLAVVATPGDGSDEDNGVYVYLAKPEENRLTLALAAPNVAWGNLAMYGQEPELAALANGSLEDACGTLSPGQHPVCHSDRGCHYRWPGWIGICEGNGLTRSMSKKGCSPDNSACEGFFGRLKNTDNGNRAIDDGYRRKCA